MAVSRFSNALKINALLSNNATKRPLRRLMSLKVTDFGTSGKLRCNFLFVNNTNLQSSYLAPFPRRRCGQMFADE